MSERKPADMIVWCDCETGDLNIESPLLEIAFVLTDNELNICDSGKAYYHSVVCDVSPTFLKENIWEGHRSGTLIEDINKYNLDYHSGVPEPTSQSVEQEVIHFMNRYGVHGFMENKPPLGGSSVWFDRLRIERYMPRVAKFISHRNIDVSTIRELQLRWAPDVNPPESKGAHRALDDILESIDVLRFFRKNLPIGKTV